MLEKIENKEIDPTKIWFSDEAHFRLDGYVNSQNYRIWSSENHHEFREKPLHPEYLSVWCAIDGSQVIGPFFFYTTLNADGYYNIIEQFVNDDRVDLDNHFFQQDGAPCHRNYKVMDLLESKFGGRLISLKKNKYWIQWSPYSPDLSPLDFFLWAV